MTTRPPSPRRRVGAALIDIIPIVLIYSGAYGISVASASVSTTHWVDGGDFAWTAHEKDISLTGIVAFVIAGLIALGYAFWNWRRQRRTGSSIGKSVLNFNVVDVDAARPVGSSAQNRIARFWIPLLLIVAVGGLDASAAVLAQEQVYKRSSHCDDLRPAPPTPDPLGENCHDIDY